MIDDWLRNLALLFTRWYLVYPMWIGGTQKLMSVEGTTLAYEYVYNIPFPQFMVYLTGIGEAGGALGLLLGVSTRFSAFGIGMIMLVAAATAHLGNGWAIEHNGMEMCITYTIMSLILLSHGGGNLLTFQPWINRKCRDIRNKLPFGKYEEDPLQER
jgi:putative oxidoreductase